MKLWQGVNAALRDAMAEDESVIVMGQDVAVPGGPYGLTRGLLDRFGPQRVRDAPISEAALMGCAVGAAMTGLRPVVEIMFLDFIGLAIEQLVNQAAKFSFFTRGAPLPLVVHSMYGGRASMGAQHSQSLEAWLCHIPGIKVAFPSTPQDCYEVLRDAISDPGPVVVIESIALLRDEGELDASASRMSSVGRSRLVRSGERATLVSWGPALRVCEAAIDAVGGDIELIDLRWLRPWDETAVRQSFRRTGRLLVVHDAVEAGGWGAEIISAVMKEEFWHLDAAPLRLGASTAPLPVAKKDWESVLPNTERVVDRLRQLLA